MNCYNCGKAVQQNSTACPSCGTQLNYDAASGLLALGGLLLGGWVAAKLVKKGFSFLKEVDWASLNEELKKAIQHAQMDLTTITDNSKRLDRAESLLESNDEISVDQAAMLASATLEGGLKALAQNRGIRLDAQESEGMAEIAILLRDKSVLSHEECQKVRNFAYKVRNPVMHGDFSSYQRPDVKEQIAFTRSLFAKYGLINSFAY